MGPCVHSTSCRTPVLFRSKCTVCVNGGFHWQRASSVCVLPAFHCEQQHTQAGIHGVDFIVLGGRVQYVCICR